MDWKRIGLSICSFLVIIALLISWSPIKAEAVVAEAAIAGAGVLAVLFAMAMGVVFTDMNAATINGMGASMTDHLTRWGTSSDEMAAVEGFLSSLPSTFDNSSTDVPARTPWNIPTAILGALIGWASTLINGEGIEVEGEAAPDGFLYYNGILLPAFTAPEGHPYVLIYNYYGYTAFFSSEPFIFCTDTRGNYAYSPGVLKYSNYNSSTKLWGDQMDSSSHITSYTQPVNFIWANHDVIDERTGELFLASDEPSASQTDFIEPKIFVGNIPQQVQDGTFDEEKYALPFINYADIFQGQTDTVSALNNVAAQLQNQSLTYEQYMEQIMTEVGSTSEPITGTFADTAVGTFINSLVDALVAPLLEGIRVLFVPAEGYIESKVDSLTSEYAFANSIALTAKDLRAFLVNLGSVPPVIRIDLGAYTGSYNLGGEMVFIDFSFYDPYKPTMDAILSAFLWLWFVWRVTLGLPGIIGGLSGIAGPRGDSSHVGVSGPIGSITPAVNTPKHILQPGGTAHVNAWIRARNDAHYNQYHRRGK